MSQFNLLKQRKFAPLFWTQFLGAFNDNLLKNAIVMLVTFRAAHVMGIPANQMVSAAGGIFILPFFVFSATAGQLADKHEKGRIIRMVKLAEIVIMALATYGFVTNHFPFLLAVLFLMGLHSTFFGPLKYSILPQHLDEHELVGGNALVEAGTFLSILLGTIAGGLMIALPDTGPAWVSATLLVISVLGFAASTFIPEARPVAPKLHVQWNPVTPTWEILRFAAGNRVVFLSILGISWFWFFGAASLSLLPSLCKDVLGAPESVVTVFLASFSIGIGIGSMLCERLSRRSLELGLVPLGSLGISLFALDLSFAADASHFPAGLLTGVTAFGFLHLPQGLHVVVDLVLIAMSCGLFIVPLYALMQERSEVSHRSRVIAANNILNALFMVAASALLVMLMKAGLSIPRIFLVLAILNGVVALYIYTLLPEFLLRFVMWMIANVMYRLKIEGDKAIPDRGPAILVCNHVSFVDWLIIGAAIHRPVRFVMHHSFAQGFLGRRLMMRGKVIRIASAQESTAILRNALESIAEELEAGNLVCIFPEGTITRTGEMGPFKTGIERMLERTPVPVIPMALNGLWGSFFSRMGGRAMSRPPQRLWSRVELRIGAPVPAPEATARLLREKVAGLQR